MKTCISPPDIFGPDWGGVIDGDDGTG